MSNPPSQSKLCDMPYHEITIRPAYADDQVALRRLAELDSARTIPPHPLLVAETDGELRVALSVHDGTAIADPFFPTAAILGMLRSHVRANKWQRRLPPRLRGVLRPAARTAPAWSR